MWPGSNFEYKGRNCTFTGVFNENMKWEDRADIALSWFNHEKTPANLVMLYMEEPDTNGHYYGPESSEVHRSNVFFFYFDKYGSFSFMRNLSSHSSFDFFPNKVTKAVARLDNFTRHIQDKLIATGLNKRVNVVHVSDHGMIGVAPPNFIYLDKILAKDNCEIFGTSPVLQVVPKDKSE